MAGHSHWARIKHQKGAADAKRGQLFSKLAKGIISAARHGGGDPDANLKLRYAIDKARASNMTRDSIERAIKRGTGELGGAAFEEILYEGYGKGGAAILVEVLTDNRHRSSPELKKIFERHGGHLGASGSVAWMFEKKALFTVKAGAVPEERVYEAAIEAGAEDVTNSDGAFQVTGEPTSFPSIKAGLEKAKIPLELSEIGYRPKTTVPLDASAARQVLALMEELDNNEDVQNTHSNFDIPDSVMAEMEGA
ncbi:MAG TPA: YebC/PmpR family DNA-binding transcriptional regulator [Planctomycetota bacterium]|jgi:YebC/PmpR family DNA-binding regulatory protein|nr:YebC/PmpR family DNA-binding transcriptional regulator [Planctomycetota bacterium]